MYSETDIFTVNIYMYIFWNKWFSLNIYSETDDLTVNIYSETDDFTVKWIFWNR